ncbi:MAG TPA: hypothetical protein VLG47_01170 [Candidatus Saccharimonadales bacterium]|nr:hypothetical protein [Candidatus Saccharimonadales bacterium]
MSMGLVAENFVHDPPALSIELTQAGALDFRPHPSGLFVASYMADAALTNVIDMGHKAWWRDNGIIARGLAIRGTDDDLIMARGVGGAFLKFLHMNESLIDAAIQDPDAPRLPVRVDATTFANDNEPRDQTDSTAYTIWLPGWLALHGIQKLSRDDLGIMSKVVRYLDAGKYWRRPDQGCWEEDTQLHASSIGAAVAGLEAVEGVFADRDYRSSIEFKRLIGRGKRALHGILPFETPPSVTFAGRPFDASHLFLAETFRALSPAVAMRQIWGIHHNLVREHGVIRYIRDTYFGPGFTQMLEGAARTQMSEESLKQRDTLANETERTQSEAQWMLFDSILSAYWGRRFESSHNQGHRRLQLEYMNRYLAQHIQIAGGGLRIPELKYRETVESDVWQPNDHTPLLMAQATGLLALHQFEQTAA